MDSMLVSFEGSVWNIKIHPIDIIFQTVKSYTLAKREIVAEKAEMAHYSAKSKNCQKQHSLPFEPVSYGRISSDPKF